MSRIDAAPARVDLGPCDCPGKPHTSDWADAREDLTYGDLRRATSVVQSEAVTVVMLRCTEAWNLVDKRGEKLPITIETLDALRLPQASRLFRHYSAPAYRDQILRFLGEEMPESGPPNPSSGPSADGSAETQPRPSSSPASDAEETAPVTPSDTSPRPSSSTAPSSPASSPTSS